MRKRRRGWSECMCKYCAPPGPYRKWLKRRVTTRRDRHDGKLDLKEQYEDYEFGIDPD